MSDDYDDKDLLEVEENENEDSTAGEQESDNPEDGVPFEPKEEELEQDPA